MCETIFFGIIEERTCFHGRNAGGSDSVFFRMCGNTYKYQRKNKWDLGKLLFFCDAFLFAVAVAGYKFITVLLPYTEVGAKGSFPKNVLLLYGCTVIAQLLFKTYDSL